MRAFCQFDGRLHALLKTYMGKRCAFVDDEAEDAGAVSDGDDSDADSKDNLKGFVTYDDEDDSDDGEDLVDDISEDDEEDEEGEGRRRRVLAIPDEDDEEEDSDVIAQASDTSELKAELKSLHQTSSSSEGGSRKRLVKKSSKIDELAKKRSKIDELAKKRPRQEENSDGARKKPSAKTPPAAEGAQRTQSTGTAVSDGGSGGESFIEADRVRRYLNMDKQAHKALYNTVYLAVKRVKSGEQEGMDYFRQQGAHLFNDFPEASPLQAADAWYAMRKYDAVSQKEAAIRCSLSGDPATGTFKFKSAKKGVQSLPVHISAPMKELVMRLYVVGQFGNPRWGAYKSMNTGELVAWWMYNLHRLQEYDAVGAARWGSGE